MRVRDGTEVDVEDVIRLDAIARRDVARAELIARILASGDCLLAERQGRIIAYAAIEYTFFEHGFIPILYVAESERRRGAGRALMEALVSRCRTRKLFTSTNQSNRPMKRLLESLDFVPSGVIHNLDPGDPELVYFFDRGRGR